MNNKFFRTGLAGFLNHGYLPKVAFILALSFGFVNMKGFTADQWLKLQPAGTANLSDTDSLIISNNESLDRLIFNFRIDCRVIPDTNAQFKVKAGEIAIPNSGGTIVKWRRNTSDTTVTWADIDTGAEANSTAYYVYTLADADATTFTIQMSTNSSAPSGGTQYRQIGRFYNNSSGNIEQVTNVDYDQKVIQFRHVSDSAVATGTTTLPNDDTIPQSSEGNEFITIPITPTDSSNSLFIQVNINLGAPADDHLATALFQDATAGALSAIFDRPRALDYGVQHTLFHKMAAGTTDTTTFKVRSGSAGAGTVTFNGDTSARKAGGVMASSITVWEVQE